VLLRAVPVDFGAIDIQNLSAAPKEALAVIAAGVIALIGGIGAAASAGGQMGGAATAPSAAVTQAEPEVPPPLPRENAVLVLGATGRAGRLIVQEVRCGAVCVPAGAAAAILRLTQPSLQSPPYTTGCSAVQQSVAIRLAVRACMRLPLRFPPTVLKEQLEQQAGPMQ
jgi:hypothetical protein